MPKRARLQSPTAILPSETTAAPTVSLGTAERLLAEEYFDTSATVSDPAPVATESLIVPGSLIRSLCVAAAPDDPKTQLRCDTAATSRAANSTQHSPSTSTSTSSSRKRQRSSVGGNQSDAAAPSTSPPRTRSRLSTELSSPTTRSSTRRSVNAGSHQTTVIQQPAAGPSIINNGGTSDRAHPSAQRPCCVHTANARLITAQPAMTYAQAMEAGNAARVDMHSRNIAQIARHDNHTSVPTTQRHLEAGHLPRHAHDSNGMRRHAVPPHHTYNRQWLIEQQHQSLFMQQQIAAQQQIMQTLLAQALAHGHVHTQQQHRANAGYQTYATNHIDAYMQQTVHNNILHLLNAQLRHNHTNDRQHTNGHQPMIVHAANSPWLIDSPDALVQVAEQMAAAAAQAYNRMPKGMLKQQIDALPTYRWPASEKESQMCVVCMCDIVARHVVRPLPCNHIYHARCIDKWLKTNRTCPVCRADASRQVDVKASNAGPSSSANIV